MEFRKLEFVFGEAASFAQHFVLRISYFPNLGYNTVMAKAKKTTKSKKASKNKRVDTSTIAKSDDGTIQINFTIPHSSIKKAKEEVAKEEAKNVNIPGFRPGKAPLDKVLEKIPENELLEKSLSKILPNLLTSAVEKHKIVPAIYPKFELVSAKENEDWQIRAVTCELPKIELGNYKKGLSSLKKVSTIWTPGKEKGGDTKEPTREENEQSIMKYLLESIKFEIPKVLIDEEVNNRLSKLLERIEKLGLTLESYLTSINKSAQSLRKEYETQAKNSLAIDLILTEISKLEKLEVDKKDIDAAVTAGNVDPKLQKELDTPERRRFIEAILKRRKALDFITSLL